MKVVSLNIRHGGGKRLRQIMAWLNAQHADFILLTEWRANASGAFLKAALEDNGYISFGEARDSAANGVLVSAKRPFSTSRLTPKVSTNGEIIAADLENGVRILCCYFPQLLAKKPFFDVCLEQASEMKTPLLLVGDLNTGRNDIDLEEGATKFACANQFVELTNSAGMIDLWRQSNGPETREWTWRSQKNGFRIDHAFGNQAFISSAPTTKCWYDHSTKTDDLTDHSGMIVDVIFSNTL
jgi:exodeoxyribonuclease-3